jgi:hypothetical protein
MGSTAGVVAPGAIQVFVFRFGLRFCAGTLSAELLAFIVNTH